jgi:hypothetical protein
MEPPKDSTTRLESRHEKPTAFGATNTPKSPCTTASASYPSPTGSPTDSADEAEKKDEESLSIDPPFSSSSNDYVYDQIATDLTYPTRVEIAFTPKKPNSRTVEGTAWVDTASGTLLTAGAKLSKPPAFVDWIHFTVEFGANTPLGPAMSRIGFEVKGGFLFFIRKHVRGEVKMTDYRIAP